MHPEDERYLHLHGRKARLPLVDRLIPIVADTYSDPEKGTGAVKITPAHDFNDFEVGARHDLPRINVLDSEGRIFLRDNAEFLADASTKDEVLFRLFGMHGMDRFEARKAIVAEMDLEGLLDKVEPHRHPVPHGDRSGVIIEPWLTDQWYVDAKALAGPALEAVRSGRTNFVPKNWEKTYFDWLENIQPWCISRQLWWGHQIPAWYSAWGGVYVAEDEDEAVALALADAVTREIYDDVEAGEIAEDPIRRADLLTRDEDVLDTWFSSALWPFSTLGWPDKTPELARYYPTTALVTGFDIIFFWVARMMMMGLHVMDEVPFRDVYIHALVRDEKGAKMSKSKGNVIDPLDLIDKYGADALRFTLAAMAAQGRDIKLATSRVEGYRNFATKLWNAARFAEMNECRRAGGYSPAANKVTLNRWIIGELAGTTASVTKALEDYRFNEAAGAVYRFIWNIFCDWYLELAKPILQGEDGAAKDETRATTAFVLDRTIALLHPFMPFITEELARVFAERDGRAHETVLALSAWPVFNHVSDAQAETEIGWLVELVSEVRSVRSEMNVPAGAQIPLVLVSPDTATQDRAKTWHTTLSRLARLSSIETAPDAPAGSAQILVRGGVVALPLAGVIDFAAERARLAKEIAKTQGDIAKTETKLANEDFVRRAPEEIVEENRERLVEWRTRVEKLQTALERVSA